MPKELPGFYYDAEKNRYFPLKGPIPGSSRPSSSTKATPKPALKPIQASNLSRSRIKISKLLQCRELNGDAINFKKKKCGFVDELLKTQASQPTVLKYHKTERMADGALGQMHVDILTSEGRTKGEVLLAGGLNGAFSLFVVGKVGQHFENGLKRIPDMVRPIDGEIKTESKSARDICLPVGASLPMSSSISSLKLFGKLSSYDVDVDNSLSTRHALVTTLGSAISGGSVCVLNFIEPLDLYSRTPSRQMMAEVGYFSCTIWTADLNQNSNRAVIGTNLGAALVNLETGRETWICRSKSDVLAQQFDQSGNVVLCGFRNGAILTVDVREDHRELPARLIRHRIPFSPSGKHKKSSNKQWFELRGNIYPSCTLHMPSSVCSLVSLQSYDQYFLASSMDGLIKLYDHRMTKRGAIQSYEGHVNSHTRIQLAVDPTERFLIAGGEDCNLRLWSIKSGELLYAEKVSDSAISTCCWQRSDRSVRVTDENERYREGLSAQRHSWATWCGSEKGLFYVHWS